MRDSTLGVDTWFAQDNATQLHTINRNGPINQSAADNIYRCFIFALSESIGDKLFILEIKFKCNAGRQFPQIGPIQGESVSSSYTNPFFFIPSFRRESKFKRVL